MTGFETVIEKLKGGLVVSCQARPGNPLRGARYMAAFAEAAQLAGAVGIRANGVDDIRSIRKRVSLPIIGINKQGRDRWPVYITPTPRSAASIARAGADLVAIDATHRRRRGGASPEELIAFIHDELKVPVMADIDCLEEGIAAAGAGADLVATTMAGYTPAREMTAGSDLDLVSELVAHLDCPVVCEGRVRSPGDLRAAFQAGAYAVVVGTAITNPTAITERFIRELSENEAN